MKKKVILIACTVFCISALVACGIALNKKNKSSDARTNENGTITDTSMYAFTERELLDEYSTANATYIDVATLSVSGSNASISGNKIRLTGQGTFIFSGSNENAMISVEATNADKLQIVLKNISLTNNSGPALYVKKADKVFVTLDNDTVNTLSDGKSYVFSDDTADAVVFSHADIAFNGSGTLNVNGNYKHGIVSKDGLSLAHGNFNVKAENVGIAGKEGVRIADGTFKIEAGTDGIRSDNTDDTSYGFVFIQNGSFDIKASNDGIQAETTVKIENGTFDLNVADDALTSRGSVAIAGGSFEISAGDDGIHAENDVAISGGTVNITESNEGIEGKSVNISGGRTSIIASDDGINATGEGSAQAFGRPQTGVAAEGADITVSGGYIFINANGDGIDSNGTLNFTGGVTLISGPTDSGNGALDYETECNVTGGTVAALGASGMAEGFTSVENQGGIFTNIASQQAGSSFALCDENGNVIVSFTPPKAYQSVAVTSGGIKKGNKYTMVCGGTVADTDENGYAENSSVSGGNTVISIEMTTDNYSSGGDGFGNMGGGFGQRGFNGDGFGEKQPPEMPDGEAPQMPGMMPPGDGNIPQRPENSDREKM